MTSSATNKNASVKICYSTELVVKITHGTDIRRFTTPSDALTWARLGQRVADYFALTPDAFKLTYVDDENDRITLSSDEELAEAVGLARAAAPPVLRLTVHPRDAPNPAPNHPARRAAAPTPTPDASAPDADDAKKELKEKITSAAPAELAPFLEQLVEQLPAAMASLPCALRHLLPHAELDVAATIAANQPGHPAWANPPACGQEGADAFCPREPHAPGAAADVHEGVTCDKSGMCPIKGNRYHLVGHNYDLCEAEYDKLTDKEKALFRKVPPPSNHSDDACRRPSARAVGLHPGVECDRTGMCPIVGTRYHLRGHDYDLCQAAYDQLAPSDKALYEAIPPPVGGLNHLSAMPWRPAPCGWRGRHAAGRMGDAANAASGFNGTGGGAKLAARFVRDVTIFDGTQVSPGTAFTKIWRLKNVGEVPWPAGTKMMFVGGDQMTTEMSVPLSRGSPVAPGEEVDVAVEMVAPLEHGRYLGYWRLTGPHGRRKFGQRVWCHVQVVDPSAEALLGDPQATLDEIERKKQSLAATDPDPDADHDSDDAEVKGKPHPGPYPQANDTHTNSAMTNNSAMANDAASKEGSKPAAEVEAKAATTATTATTATKPPPIGTSAATQTPPPTALVDAAVGEALKDAEHSDDGEMVEAPPETSSDAETRPAAADPGPSSLHTAGAPTPPPPATNTKASRDAIPEAQAGMGVTVDAASGGAEPKSALLAMGFSDLGMIETVLAKNGDDLEACARDLAAASEWDPLLEDLEEMGFTNRELNQTLMLKHAGNIKRTVKDLVEA